MLRPKLCFFRQSWAKDLGQSRNPVKLDKITKSSISTFACFLAVIPKFKFWKGVWALGYVSTQIWDFPNIWLFSKIASLKSFGNLWGNSYTKFAILGRYQVSFYIWLIGSVLKHCKVPKYYDQDCLKAFFLLSKLPMVIQISRKRMLIWFKKVSSIKKLPISNGGSFQESIFGLT